MQNDGSVSPVKAFFRNKWVRLILIVDVIAIIAVIGIVINNNTKTATLNISVAPVDAEVILNGKGGYGNGSYNLHPGIYEVEVKRDTLESKYFTLELKSDYDTTLATFLTGPDNSFEFYELKGNYDSFSKLASIASEEGNQTIDQNSSAYQFIKDFQKDYSIYDILPIIDQTPTACGMSCGASYQYDTLKISDGRSLEQCTKTLCLYITDTTGSKKDFALSAIKKLGYNPDLFQVIYEEVGYE